MVSINPSLLLLLIAGAGTTARALNAFAGPAVNAKGAKAGRVDAGPITLSEIGFGTWSWGNKLLWDYDPSQDEEIYQSYKCLRDRGVSVFDTADSYGTLQLNGRAEILLGSFERRYQSELAQQGGADDGGLLGGLFSPKPYTPPPQQVATKFAPYPWRISRKSMVKAARESLERLEQEKLSIAQLHWSTGEFSITSSTHVFILSMPNLIILFSLFLHIYGSQLPAISRTGPVGRHCRRL